MNKIKTILLAFAAATCLTATAQSEETEITVHDDNSGKDEVITLPEGMTASCDSLLSEWLAKQYIYVDSTCNKPNFNPSFTDDEYKERLGRLPVVMEMPYNSVVRKFIDRYMTNGRRSVAYMLGAANMYVPIFEEALDYYGLPLELKYLPVIESGLEAKAKSHAGAVGLWQFMLATAKRYDLTVNSLIDERQDPYKATWAAARYLRDLYSIFGDWNLVIAAYNCGPTTINKAIHRADGVKDYWKVYPYLPAETRGYVPAFIAANYAMNYYCEHNICPMKARYPVTVDSVVVNRDLHMDQIAALCGIEKDAIKALNPQYRTDLIPGSVCPMTLSLPADNLATFIDLKDSVYNYRADELFKRRSEVTIDERLDHRSVAQQRRSAASSSRANRTSNNVSASKSSHKSSKNDKRKQKQKAEKAKTTTVKNGDTLSDIARRNGTTVQKLRKLNNIKGDLINSGKKIRVK